MSENRFADATSLTSVVHQIVGAGSMCWEYVDRAGVFDSETAQEVASEGSERILELFRRETTDHYAEAERLLGAVGNTADAEDRRQCLMEAQVHVGLDAIDEQRRMAARMDATAAVVERAATPLVELDMLRITDLTAGDSRLTPAASRTIPWPPSDELVETVANAIWERTKIGNTVAIARAVLDAIGGEA